MFGNCSILTGAKCGSILVGRHTCKTRFLLQKKADTDLRKAVILRQALNRRSSNTNSSISTFLPSPPISPIQGCKQYNNTTMDDPINSTLSSKMDDTDDVFEDPDNAQTRESTCM